MQQSFYNISESQGTRNCRACDRTSRIAYRARSNARDLRRRYIFRWRLTRCLQIPRAYAHMHVRTHARIRSRCLPARSIVCTGAILFYNGQKAIETDRRVTSVVTAGTLETPFYMSDNTLFTPEKKAYTRELTYVIANEGL